MKYGDYEHRGTARSRFILTKMGEDAFRTAVRDAVRKAREEGIPQLELEPIPALSKTGKDDRVLADPRIRSQKQEGLYYVEYKPLGGVPNMEVFRQLLGAASQMEGAQLRLNADETVHHQPDGGGSRKVAALTETDTARTAFEHSVSCIGATVCQQGLCDSHGALARIAAFLKEQGADTRYLPKCHFPAAFHLHRPVPGGPGLPGSLHPGERGTGQRLPGVCRRQLRLRERKDQ